MTIKVLLCALLGLAAAAAAALAVAEPRTGAAAAKAQAANIARADFYAAANGDDKTGDGSLKKPFSTVDRARAAIRARLPGPGQKRDWTVLFRGGTYFLPATLTFTPADAAGPGHHVIYAAYPGESVVWSGGTDISSLLRPASLPALGLASVCQAEIPGPKPFSHDNANYYFGEIWVNGVRAAEPIRPQRGSEWFHARTDGFSTPWMQVARFTSNSKTVTLSHPEWLPGRVGSAIAFTEAGFGFQQNRPYWIVAMSGDGVELAASPGGPALPAKGGGALSVQDNIETAGPGDRYAIAHKPSPNGFGFHGGEQPELSSAWTNITDIKIQMPGGNGGTSIVPVQSIDDAAQTVTLNSHLLRPERIFAQTAWRRWNRFEDIGPGEMYLNRQTGVLTYVPRVGESCAGLKVIAPRLTQLLLISNSRAAGGPIGVAAGNLAFDGIAFSHTQSSVFSGAFDVAGASGGVANNTLLSHAIVTVGATNVVFDHDSFVHLGEGGILSSFGSNHVTVSNSLFSDLGGGGITAGANLLDKLTPYKYSSHLDVTGTNADGATTPDSPVDASNCCLTVSNNVFDDISLVGTYSGAIHATYAQNDAFFHNTIRNIPSFGLMVESGWEGVTPANYNGAISPGSFGTTIAENEIYNCGYEKNPAGAPIAGATMANDFGCLYIRGPHDGDGTQPRMSIVGNKVHDCSSGVWLTFNGKQPEQRPHGFDCVLDYHDGDDSFGINEASNLYYFINALDPLHKASPNVIVSYTGNMRDTYRNNIYYGYFPTGYRYRTDFVVQSFHGPVPEFHVPAYGAKPYMEFSNNIVAVDQPGGPAVPLHVNVDIKIRHSLYRLNNNLYFERGQKIAYMVNLNGSLTPDEWRAPPYSQDQQSAFDVDPNFTDPAHGDFTFKRTGAGAPCGGTGGVSPACGLAEPFVPWDYSRAGAHGTIGATGAEIHEPP